MGASSPKVLTLVRQRHVVGDCAIRAFGSSPISLMTLPELCFSFKRFLEVHQRGTPSAHLWSCSSRGETIRLRQCVLVPRLATSWKTAHPQGQRVATALGIPCDRRNGEEMNSSQASCLFCVGITFLSETSRISFMF